MLSMTERRKRRTHKATPPPAPRLFEDPEYLAYKAERERLGLATDRAKTDDDKDGETECHHRRR